MPTQELVNFQGAVLPKSVFNEQRFAQLTRRLTFSQQQFSFAGLGLQDIVQMRQTGIISHLSLRLTGQVVVALNGGTAATTHKWPYGLLSNIKFAANGASNLQNISGWGAKILDATKRGELNDRGIVKKVTGAHPGTDASQGTLSLNSETWGIGSQVTAIPSGTYAFDLQVPLHIAADQVSLVGSVFAQQSTTDLSLILTYASLAELFTLTGNATATFSVNVIVEGTVYSVPRDGDQIVLPDLSMFHQVTENVDRRLGNGEYESRLTGQGVGRQMLRILFRTINNGLPLAANAANYGKIGWRFGGNDTPEEFSDGLHLRQRLERLYGSDVGAVFGYLGIDFASEWAARDVVDMGESNDLRLIVNYPQAVAFTSPSIEIIQEVLFSGAVGA